MKRSYRTMRRSGAFVPTRYANRMARTTRPLMSKSFKGQDRVPLTLKYISSEGAYSPQLTWDLGPLNMTGAYFGGGGSVFAGTRVEPQWPLYEKHHIKAMSFEYSPRLGTEATGVVHMGFDFDPLDYSRAGSPAGVDVVRELSATPGYVSAPVYAPLTASLRNRRSSTTGEWLFPVKYNDAGVTPQQSDELYKRIAVRSTNSALFFFYIDGVAPATLDDVNGIVGDLTVSYELELISPTHELPPDQGLLSGELEFTDLGLSILNDDRAQMSATSLYPYSQSRPSQMWLSRADGTPIYLPSSTHLRVELGESTDAFLAYNDSSMSAKTSVALTVADTLRFGPEAHMEYSVTVASVFSSVSEASSGVGLLVKFASSYTPGVREFIPFDLAQWTHTQIPSLTTSSPVLGQLQESLTLITSPPDSLEADGPSGVWKAREETLLADGVPLPGSLVPQGAFDMDPSRLVLLHNTGLPWSGLSYANGDSFTGEVLFIRGASLVMSYTAIGLTPEYGLTSVTPATGTVTVGSMKDILGRDVFYEIPSGPGVFQIIGDFYYVN